MFIVQACHTSQYVVPRGGIFLGKWRSSFAGNFDGKMNVQLTCALNTRCIHSFIPKLKTKLRGLSPQANYTDRAAAAVGEVVPTFADRGVIHSYLPTKNVPF
jgi:hypothetical protein